MRLLISGGGEPFAEMLGTGWYSAVHVKSEASHKLKAQLGARGRWCGRKALGNQVRG